MRNLETSVTLVTVTTLKIIGLRINLVPDTIPKSCVTEEPSRLCTKLMDALQVSIIDSVSTPLTHTPMSAILRSLNLWIKGCVKSHAFLLRHRGCFPSPSVRAPASQRTILSKNTSSSVHLKEQITTELPFKMRFFFHHKLDILLLYIYRFK